MVRTHLDVEAPDGSVTELCMWASRNWPESALNAGQGPCLLVRLPVPMEGPCIPEPPLMAARFIASGLEAGCEGPTSLAVLAPIYRAGP